MKINIIFNTISINFVEEDIFNKLRDKKKYNSKNFQDK